MPKARPRSSGSVKVVVKRASTEGASRAPNAPWTVRAMTSIAKLTDNPPMAEAAAKTTRPMTSARFRPTIALGTRQGYVHDGAVENNHQLGDSQHSENPPSPAVVGPLNPSFVPTRVVH